MVQLFEKGYGKDAAGIAMEAIAFGSVGTKGLVVSLSLGICTDFGKFWVVMWIVKGKASVS